MKFNTKTTNKVVNRAGGQAYKQSDELSFVSILLTSFLKDQFYRSGNDTMKDLAELTGKVDPYFAAQASLYARKEFGMRSVSHVVAGEIAKKVKGMPWTKNYFEQIVHRLDDMLEIVGYLGIKNPIPNSVKKGFKKVLEKTDLHFLTKYRKAAADISMHDLVNLFHPKSEAVSEFMKGAKSKETWETKLTETQGNVEAKEKAWTDLLVENKLGYLALIRNLRNLEGAKVDIDLVAERLVNEQAIKKSLVYPFQIFEAAKHVSNRKLITALSKALELSLDNVPEMEGETLVVVDDSYSMNGDPITKAAIFAAVLCKVNNCDLMNFSDNARYARYNPLDTVTTLTAEIVRNIASGGTNFHSIFQTANKKYDRIIILSDMQGWIGYDSPGVSFAQYKAKYGANPHVYSFDLAGYGDMQFPEQNVYCLAGFHPKVFEIMKLLESDKNAMINMIKQIEV